MWFQNEEAMKEKLGECLLNPCTNGLAASHAILEDKLPERSLNCKTHRDIDSPGDTAQYFDDYSQVNCASSVCLGKGEVGGDQIHWLFCKSFNIFGGFFSGGVGKTMST